MDKQIKSELDNLYGKNLSKQEIEQIKPSALWRKIERRLRGLRDEEE